MKAATVINLKNEKRVEYIKKLFIFIIPKKILIYINKTKANGNNAKLERIY